MNGLAAGFAFAECVRPIMHHAVEVVGNAKEVAVVVHFKVALLPLSRGWERKETSNKRIREGLLLERLN